MNPSPPTDARLCAVIDMGAHAVRMVIAQIGKDGRPHTLDSVQQSIAIGKDTFTSGRIGHQTTQACVKALSSFRKLIEEYHMDPRKQVRAVATSAVREAANRDAFLDRLYMATGIAVEPIDEAEVNRYTYLSVRDRLLRDPLLKNACTLILDFGAGNTEALVARRNEVIFSQTYQTGALRMRERLDDFAPSSRTRPQLLLSHIERALSILRMEAPLNKVKRLLLLGNSARFAAHCLHPRRDRRSIMPVPLDRMRKLAHATAQSSAERLARDYHLDFNEAETLPASLLFHVRLGALLGLDEVLLCDAALCNGLLADTVEEQANTGEYGKQVLRSARRLAAHYESDARRGRFMAGVCSTLFRALQKEHRLPPRYELLLNVAALLHDVGLYVSKRAHHKHSFYLIRHSELFGLGARQRLLVALMARYHRKAEPGPRHEGYDLLDREERIVVTGMAALLRIADALGEGGLREAGRVEVRLTPSRLYLDVSGAGDLFMERMAMNGQARLFEQVYGREVVLRPAKRKE